MILANEAVAAFLAGRKARVPVPRPRAAGAAVRRAPAREARRPRGPDAARSAHGEHEPVRGGRRSRREASELVADYVAKAGRGREAFPALVLRALKQAHYDPRNLGHSGLASTAYTHFTSPIRRYPDLVVHRALLRAIGQGDDPLPDDLQAAAEHTSETERAATDIEYRADDICAAWLLERTLFERGWEESFAGEVIGLIPSGLFARFGDVFEGFVPARRLHGDYYELNDLGTALVGRRGGQRYRLGDEIDVRVEEIRRSEGKIELAPTAASGSGRGGGRRGRSGRRRPGSRAR